MYFRQCWRETRIGFVVALLLMVFLAWFSARLAVPTHSARAEMLRRSPIWSLTWEDEWDSGARTFGFYGVLPGLLMGLGFGASGIGNHASRGLHEFLFTRPRRRRYLAWGSWLAGASQVLLLVILAAFMLGSVLAFMTEHFLVSTVLIAALGVGLPSLVVFSLSHWLTAFTRNPRSAIIYATAGCVVYISLASFVYFQMHLPRLSALLASPMSYNWMRFGPGPQVPLIHLNWIPIAYQSLLVLIFALLTQRTIEHMDT